MSADIEAVLTALEHVVRAPAPLHEPEFSERDWEYVRECLESGWVSSAGSFSDRFEELIVDITGVEHAIATVNGTAALHVCLQLAGTVAGDEVLLPALNFIAAANAVSYVGAIPHFVDSDEKTLGINPQALAAYLEEIADITNGHCVNRRTGNHIRAVVAVHLFGHPVDLDPIADLCHALGITLIEDAAEALGSRYKGRHVGRHGLLAALSFNGNKIVTTGGGGCVLTNDVELAQAARHLTTTAKSPHPWESIHDQIGYNSRLPSLNAALGRAQLERLEEIIGEKRALAAAYQHAFSSVAGISVFTETEFARSNYWLNTLVLDQADNALRDAILRETNAQGLGTRPVWMPLHHLPMFESFPHMELAVAEDLHKRLINVPSSACLARQLPLGQ